MEFNQQRTNDNALIFQLQSLVFHNIITVIAASDERVPHRWPSPTESVEIFLKISVERSFHTFFHGWINPCLQANYNYYVLNNHVMCTATATATLRAVSMMMRTRGCLFSSPGREGPSCPTTTQSRGMTRHAAHRKEEDQSTEKNRKKKPRVYPQQASQSEGQELVVCEYEGGRLYPGILHRRYKRFLGDVVLESETEPIVVHVPNTGPMTGLLDSLPTKVLLSKSSNPKRKYPYTLEWLHDGTTWVGVHSAKANAMVDRLLASRALEAHLPPYSRYQREVRVGTRSTQSRIDFQLVDDDDESTCLVEVKSVTMKEEGEGTTSARAVFPDTISTRAQRHVQELIDTNTKAAMIYVIQRDDCSVFAPCFEKDPVYSERVCEAHRAGVEIIPVQMRLDIDHHRVVMSKVLPHDVPRPDQTE